jgi:uncharacterized membrane protein YesL
MIFFFVQILKINKSKLPDFYDKFHCVVKNIEGFWFFFWVLSYVNYFPDDNHFDYATSQNP